MEITWNDHSSKKSWSTNFRNLVLWQYEKSENHLIFKNYKASPEVDKFSEAGLRTLYMAWRWRGWAGGGQHHVLQCRELPHIVRYLRMFMFVSLFCSLGKLKVLCFVHNLKNTHKHTHVLSFPGMAYAGISFPSMSWKLLSCLSCPVLSSPVLSFPVLSCPILPCPVLSCACLCVHEVIIIHPLCILHISIHHIGHWILRDTFQYMILLFSFWLRYFITYIL